MGVTNARINYIEFLVPDLKVIKDFYCSAFDWKFTDYGANYTAFDNSGIQGGFEQSEKPVVNGVLVILYHADLEQIKSAIIAAGGTINIDTFAFPGGKRFHFIDPAGNELAVWSE